MADSAGFVAGVLAAVNKGVEFTQDVLYNSVNKITGNAFVNDGTPAVAGAKGDPVARVQASQNNLLILAIGVVALAWFLRK